MTLKTAIFVRSYARDLQWLSYSLRAVAKFASGFEGVYIIVPASDVELMTEVCTLNGFNPPQASREELRDGYVEQQITKLQADTYMPEGVEAVLYIDSDFLLSVPVTPETFMRDGKPLLIRESYANLQGDNAAAWQKVVEKALGFFPEYEFMRRLPLIHLTETLRRTRKWIEDNKQMPLINFARQCPYHEFTEFNALGAVANQALADKYTIVTYPNDPVIPSVGHQFWSWSGVRPGDIEQMEFLLGER